MLLSLNDAIGKENSEDPDQTAPLGAVWSGFALFMQTYLSENLWYLTLKSLNFKTKVYTINFMVVQMCIGFSLL